ncbi:MAG: rRNA maturation RNase YbeY [Methylacidiphilales bacterium]|nr:rRNA maturation RNase YbeY [Candidatus Methylacidiphilales bacterium]
MPASNTPKSKENPPPGIRISNLQNRYRISTRRLQNQSEKIPALLQKKWPGTLALLEIVLVDEAESARVHREFLQDPSPTDVITFEHGELVICPAVAERQRHIEGLSLEDEILTYIIHGCLHLCGMEDHTERGFKAMRALQAKIRGNILRA